MIPDDSQESRPAQDAEDALVPLSFYSRQAVVDDYWRERDRIEGPKLAIEEPTVLAFLGDLRDCRVLDLGCGDARLGSEVLRRGARAYLGLDGSPNMVEAARQRLAGTGATVRLQDLESWSGEAGARFDVATSQLALQYVKHLPRVFEMVRMSLDSRGLFVFSVEHPILTSSFEGEWKRAIAAAWRVHGYFREGERTHRWLDSAVTKQHRTMETYVRELWRCGFQLTGFSEGRPKPGAFKDRDEYELRLEVPICAIFQCIANSS